MHDDDLSPQVLSPVIIAFASHTLWGAYPVLTKLLIGVFGLPSLVFLTSGQAITSLTSAYLARRYLRWGLLLKPAMIALMLVAASRAVTNILSIEYTLAIYVQLLNLLAPFVVALLGSLVFAEEPPPHTIKAMLVATVGAALVIVGNPLRFSVSLGPTDALGIVMALASVLALGLWTHISRLNTNRQGVEPVTTLVAQAAGVAIVSAVTSVIFGQDWGAWGQLSLRGWALFALIAASIQVGGNILQITALSRLRAAVFSSFTAWRLVVALAGGALLLNERLTSLWQIVGALVVIVTVTLYLRQRVVEHSPAI